MALKKWKELPIGGIIEKGGTSAVYNTGTWRTYKPVRDVKKCTDCLICWLYCPDTAISVKGGKFGEFNYLHCKGCGICAKVCPVKCIDMVKE